MKEAYNLFSELPFIELDKNEVKVIEEAIEICDKGNKFTYKISKGEDFFVKQMLDFQRAKHCLNVVLAGGNYYYYKKRKQAIESYSKYMRSVHLPIKKLKKEDK